jgi:hypothetical protein
MTVSGRTMISAERQFRQVAANQAQKKRSAAVRLGRLPLTKTTPHFERNRPPTAHVIRST